MCVCVYLKKTLSELRNFMENYFIMDRKSRTQGIGAVRIIIQ